MEKVEALTQMIHSMRSLMPAYSSEVFDMAFRKLDCIPNPERSEAWKQLGDEFLRLAESYKSNDDAYFLVVVGTACLAGSIWTKREENQSSKTL